MRLAWTSSRLLHNDRRGENKTRKRKTKCEGNTRTLWQMSVRVTGVESAKERDGRVKKNRESEREGGSERQTDR